jgi:lysophospholipase L1-like esterase
MIRIFFVLFLLVISTCLFSQQVDSSFHNYWYDSRNAYFKQLPKKKKPVIFFGDSITEWADWNELTGLGNVLNRGIAGDISFGLLGRIEEVIRHQPKQLFILIGTNDISKGIPNAHIIRTYKNIAVQLKKESPDTRLYIQSVLPINDSLINRQYYKGTNGAIAQLNKELKRMAEELHMDFVNVFECMLDGNQQLAKEYTYDGLHLSGKGYLQWVAFLKKSKYLKD